MPRLPIPGGDGGTWGDILNEFLTVSHNPNGTIKESALPISQGATGPQGPTGPPGATGPQGATGPALIDSVNGQTGVVELDAADVGALSASTVIPDVSGLQPSSEKNQANGYAGLDENARVAQVRLGTGSSGTGTKFLADDQTYKAVSSGVDPWHITIDPAFWSAESNWNTLAVNGNYFRAFAVAGGSSGSPVGYIDFDVGLAAGTWEVDVLYTGSTNGGIVTLSLDGTSVGTIDQYNVSANTRSKATVTGVAVATSGKKTLRFEITGKNVASSNYYGNIASVGLRRTA